MRTPFPRHEESIVVRETVDGIEAVGPLPPEALFAVELLRNAEPERLHYDTDTSVISLHLTSGTVRYKVTDEVDDRTVRAVRMDLS